MELYALVFNQQPTKALVAGERAKNHGSIALFFTMALQVHVFRDKHDDATFIESPHDPSYAEMMTISSPVAIVATTAYSNLEVLRLQGGLPDHAHRPRR